MQPVNVAILKHTKSDTWEGLTIGPVLFNDVQPGTTLSSCRMHFRNTGGVGFKYDTSPAAGEGTITITDSTTWEITVEPAVLGLAVGKWFWDFETTDSAGVIRTIYSGALIITKERSA